MSRRYARGKRAWGICGRCGGRALLNELVFDGHLPNMRVHQACWEPKHPQESLPRVADPVALWRPSPENTLGVTVRLPDYDIASGEFLAPNPLRLVPGEISLEESAIVFAFDWENEQT